MARKKQQEDYEQRLRDSFDHWQHLYEYGGQDPSWPDGTNLNLIRNHIYYYKHKIAETLAPGTYPEIYYRAVPPEVANDYMARSEEIRETAKASLVLYLSDENYQYLAKRIDSLNPQQAKQLCVRNVINYAAGLETAIKKDDLVTMRRHRNPDSYLSAFASCAEKVKNLKPPENEQLNLLYSSDDNEQDMEDEGWEM